MASPIDPKNFKQAPSRDPKDIAADILDFPLDKPASEKFIRSKHVFINNGFDGILSENIEDAALNTLYTLDAENPTAIIENSTIAYQRLLDGLRNIRRGKNMSSPEMVTLKKAPELIELMALEYDSFGEMYKRDINPSAESPDGLLREMRADQKGKSPSDPNYIDDRNSYAAAQYFDCVNRAKNLRGEMILLFHELAATLGISLDEGQALGRK